MKKKEQKENVWVCSVCGSKNVEVKLWINPNESEIQKYDMDEYLINHMISEDTWCNDCEDNTGIELKETDDDIQ